MSAPVPPLAVDSWPEDLAWLRSRLPKGHEPPAIFGVMANHPALLGGWMPFAEYILQRSTLEPRDREILVLRTSLRHLCLYEWRHHGPIARRAGLNEDELRQIAVGPADPGVPARTRALLMAADELYEQRRLGDEVWLALGEHFTQPERMDIVFTVGQFAMLASAVATFGIRPEDEAATDAERALGFR